MPPQRGGGDKVTAHGSEGGGPMGGSPGRFTPDESGLNILGVDINYYPRRDEFDSYCPIELDFNRYGYSIGMDQYYNIPIYINSFAEFVVEEDEHKEVDRKILDIECELEVDPEFDKWEIDKTKFLEDITVKLINTSELEDEVPYVGTHILSLHIKNNPWISGYSLSNLAGSLEGKGLLEDYTKQDTFKYYYNNMEGLWNDGYYLRFWVKVTQKESNKSIRIPIYSSIPVPQPPVG